MDLDQTCFDPAQYLNNFYADPKEQKIKIIADFVRLRFQWAQQAFDLIPQSESYLQIGSGPVLLYAGIASKKCQNLYLTDYNTESFKYITKELEKTQSQKFFWQPHFKFYQNILKSKPSQIQKRLKQRVQMCFKCDISKQKIFQISYLKKMEVILSSLCIECVAKSSEQYIKIISNISQHLSIGGYLYLFAILQQSFYIVKQKKLTVFPLTLDFIQSSLKSCGFEIIKTNSKKWDQVQQIKQSDSKGVCSVLARKVK